MEIKGKGKLTVLTGKKTGFEVPGNYMVIIFLISFSILLFLFYLDFITYKGNLAGEHILYVKMDGNTGSVLKVNNRYLKNPASIKNSRNFSYGFYTIRYDIKKVKASPEFLLFLF